MVIFEPHFIFKITILTCRDEPKNFKHIDKVLFVRCVSRTLFGLMVVQSQPILFLRSMSDPTFSAIGFRNKMVRGHLKK